jgi:hypothetical protein
MRHFRTERDRPADKYIPTVEYYCVCPLVRIGTLRPLSHKRVCPPHSPADEGVQESPNLDDWRKSTLWIGLKVALLQVLSLSSTAIQCKDTYVPDLGILDLL